jgi:hypothetical protein
VEVKGSSSGIDIYVPPPAGGITRIECHPTGQSWNLHVGGLPEALKSQNVWQRLWSDWDNRRYTIETVGAELGSWLFQDAGGQALRACIDAWKTDGVPRRVVLHLHPDAAAWPWEMAAHKSSGPIAIHQALTLYRLSNNDLRVPPTGTDHDARRVPRLKLVGVDLEDSRRGKVEPLDVSGELRGICATLSEPAVEGRFELLPVDAVGEWSSFCGRVEDEAPEILHFAGHGLSDGRGLVFRNEQGAPVAIGASQLAAVLTDQRTGRCRLIVLSACSTAADGARHWQPFGSVAARLSDLGIDYVIALQVPLVNEEAKPFSVELYAALARGAAVDVAVQNARRKLMLRDDGFVSWCFVSVAVRGEPVPLFEVVPTHPIDADADLDSFAFRPQRLALEGFLNGDRSMVIVVHGPVRSGHRYVIERLRREIEQRRPVWMPVSAMRWDMAEGSPELARDLLLGALAQACGLGTHGTEAELRERLVSCIRSRTRTTALIVDIEDLLAPTTSGEAATIVALVTDIWTELMKEVGHGTTFLLLSVAYPNDDAEIQTLAADVVKRLKDSRKLIPRRLRIEVLEELCRINKNEVTSFIERTYDVDWEIAEQDADRIVRRAPDNERLFEILRQYIINSKGHARAAPGDRTVRPARSTG